MDFLFSKYDLSANIEKWREELRTKIMNLQAQEIIGVDLDALSKELADDYRVDMPVLQEQDIVADSEETDIDKSHDFHYSSRESGPIYIRGQRVIFSVPFTGDSQVFNLTASCQSCCPPQASIEKNCLQISFSDIDLKPEQVNAQFDRTLKGIKEGLNWIQHDLDSFYKSLPLYIRQLIDNRKARLEQNASVIKGLKYPLRQRPTEKLPYYNCSPKRIIPPREKRLLGRNTPPEPALEIQEYNHILDIIKNMSKVMERSPKVFRTMDEESLRQHFLVQLNGNYEGNATGETFNYNGKTDILVREDGRNIFIAECKFWKGAQTFIKTIDQILGYTSWRDTKTAILLFVKNKDFSEILAQIPSVVRQHPNFIQAIQYGEETDFRFVFSNPGDGNRRLYLSVVAFHIPE